MSNSLRDEGGASYKKAIVDAIIYVMTKLPQCRDMALLHLCEFIEDCEFVDLSVAVLSLLGREVPRTTQPSKYVVCFSSCCCLSSCLFATPFGQKWRASKDSRGLLGFHSRRLFCVHRYIRFIFNRVILETPLVRAAAVTNLAKLGLAVPTLASSIVALLRRCIYDDDNEVRDRATTYIQLLQQKIKAGADGPSDSDNLQNCYERDIPMGGNVARLAQSLHAYRLRPQDGPLTVEALPVVEAPKVLRNKDNDSSDADDNDTEAGASPTSPSSSAAIAGSSSLSAAAAAMYEIPDFASFGALVRSCAPEPLGEAEAEYVVTCTKHIFAQHIVLQFSIRNTVEDQMLEDVRVECEVLEGPALWNEAAQPVYVPAASAPFGKTVVAYTALERNPQQPITGASVLGTCLHFVLKDADPDDGTFWLARLVLSGKSCFLLSFFLLFCSFSLFHRVQGAPVVHVTLTLSSRVVVVVAAAACMYACLCPSRNRRRICRG